MICTVKIENNKIKYDKWTPKRQNDSDICCTTRNGWVVKIDNDAEKIKCQYDSNNLGAVYNEFSLKDGRLSLRDSLTHGKGVLFKPKDLCDFLKRHRIQKIKPMSECDVTILKKYDSPEGKSTYKIWSDGRFTIADVSKTGTNSLEGATWCVIAKASVKYDAGKKRHYYSVVLYYDGKDPLELDSILPQVSISVNDDVQWSSYGKS